MNRSFLSASQGLQAYSVKGGGQTAFLVSQHFILRTDEWRRLPVCEICPLHLTSEGHPEEEHAPSRTEPRRATLQPMCEPWITDPIVSSLPHTGRRDVTEKTEVSKSKASC